MESKKFNWFPSVLLIGYVIVFAVLAINPYARDVWFAENLTILPIVVILAVMYWRGVRFSNTSYLLMSFLIFMHTVGGHFTFERVPFEFVKNLFGWERNNYDRIAHFTVGFYAYPIVESFVYYKLITKKWIAYLFAVFAIVTLAAFYELFEWWYAVSSNPEAGIAVLGSQGDMWDAQKDMLADTLGAISAALLYFGLSRSKNKKLENHSSLW